MSEAPLYESDADDLPAGDTPTALALAPDAVVVRRNAGLAALVGGLASAVAIAWAARAAQSGAVVDWTLAVVLGALGIGHLAALLDARTPLLVADAQGVRMRLGRTWGGLPWGALARVEHSPRRGLLRDGRLVMVVHNPARLLEELDRGARRQSRLCQRLYGAPFALPLGLSTRVTGAGDDLTGALTTLAAGSSRVVEVGTRELEVEEPVETERHLPDPRPRLAHALFRVSGLLQRERSEDDADGPDIDVLVEEVPGADGDAGPLVASATRARCASRASRPGPRSPVRWPRPRRRPPVASSTAPAA